MSNDTGATAPKVAAQVESVKMQDGQIVDFAGKRQMIKTPEVGDGYASVRFDFRNGEVRVVKIDTSHPLFTRFAAHGIAQKIGDEAAGEKDVEDSVLAIDDLIERAVVKTEWTTRKEGGGMGGTSVLLRAMVEHTGKPIETIKAFLKGKNHNEKLALRNSKTLKPIVERLEAEKVNKAAKVDTEALLAELDAVPV